MLIRVENESIRPNAADMALYKEKPVMIGADETFYLTDDPYTWRSNASYFETFDTETEEWSDLKRNPFFPEYTASYYFGTSVTKEDSFLVFGGEVDFYTDKSSQIYARIERFFEIHFRT